MSGADYTLRTTDTQPTIEYETDIDLAGASVTFSMRDVDGHTPVIVDGASGTIEDEKSGVVSYTLSESDTTTAGEYVASFTVTYDDGGVERFPDGEYIFIKITPAL